jgi:putative peptidoglycan lipid II flippase
VSTTAPSQRFDRGRLVRTSSQVAAGTLLSRLTGLLRIVFTAAAIGDRAAADAYNLANVAPNIVYELLVGGILSATLVPLFVRAQEQHDDEGPSAIASLSFGAVVALTSVAVLGAPLVARLYGSSPGVGASGQKYDLLVVYLHLILPEILFYGLTALLTAALNARRRFAAAAFAPALNNVVVCLVMLFIAKVYGPNVGSHVIAQLVVGLGTTAGIAAMAFVLLVAWRRTPGAHFEWNWDIHHPLVRDLRRMAGWTVGYVIANQVALFVVLRMANHADPGTVTAYQLAFVFFQLPHGLITVTIMTTFLPELSESAGSRNMDAYRRRFATGIRLIMSPLLSAGAWMLVFAAPLARFALDHGAFTTHGADTVGATVAVLALGLPAFSTYLYTCQGFYALKDTRTPFLVSVLENTANVLLALLFVRWGSAGLGGAYAIAYWIAAVVIVRVLQQVIRFHWPLIRDTLRGVSRSLFLAVVVGLIGWGVARALEHQPDLVVLLVGGLVTGTVFVLGGFAIRADGFVEARTFLVRRWAGRHGAPGADGP